MLTISLTDRASSINTLGQYYTEVKPQQTSLVMFSVWFEADVSSSILHLVVHSDITLTSYIFKFVMSLAYSVMTI